MITEVEKQILKMIREESKRVKYGKLFIEVNVNKNKITNIQTEYVRKSMNINHDNVYDGRDKVNIVDEFMEDIAK